MVSKVAVMALVGILAVPILLGYGLNLTETTETDYELDNDPVNVTQLLYNRTAYSSTAGSPYQLNTNFSSGTGGYPIWPMYESASNNLSSLPLNQEITYRTSINFNITLTNYNYYSAQYFYNTSIGHVDATITYLDDNNNTVSETLTYLSSVYYDKIQNKIHIAAYPGHTSKIINNPTKLVNSTSGSQTITLVEGFTRSNGVNSYIDLSAGYHFYEPVMINQFIYWDIKMPEKTNSAILNVDLNSITDPNYKVVISASPFGGSVTLEKTTTNGNVSWKAIFPRLYGDFAYPEETVDLMYSPNIAHNTYQITFGISPNNWEEDRHGIHYYVRSASVKLNYVGNWPQQIGKANYYTEYISERDYGSTTVYNRNFFDKIRLSNGASNNIITRSPVLRVDAASFSGFEYPVISNVNYDPAAFKTNPATKLSNPQKLGQSITFAGTTYDVQSDGNIMLGTHKTSLNGLILDSVPVAVGYENRINGNVINVSADPATITFNGDWDISISTDSASVSTWTKTEWIPGEFAWNGIDQNFLMVGLLTCLGVFVGLGIYLRKTKSSMWPLLIVCGCAAGLFFCMI